MAESILVRRVMATFEVRQVTEDNAVELAEWLRDEGRKYGVSDREQPCVTYATASGKPGLLTAFMLGATPIPAGFWVGWGWPTTTYEGDHVQPTLLNLPPTSIEAERFDQGFEEVRLG